MSWLRASRKVLDPENVEWDVYVTRAREEPPTGHFRRIRGRFGQPGTLLLDEIARGLALGKVVFPGGTRYLGEKR